jgi:CheY-like chemotaxis protein
MNKILIVDDDVRLLSTLRRMLEATGQYEVMTEDSGQRALAAAVTFKPDLIILDMNMPQMGGVEFLKDISTPDGKLKYPVLVMTSRANMAKFFDDVPVDGFMAKPCNPDDLRKEVDRIILIRQNANTKTATNQAASLTQKSILIGEDDEVVSKRLIDIFRRAGYTVDCVSLGPQMLEKAVVQKPDVILVKLILTNLNGDAVARLLREMPSAKDIPVILYDQCQHHADESKSAPPRPGVRKFVRSDSSPALLSAVADVLAGGA